MERKITKGWFPESLHLPSEGKTWQEAGIDGIKKRLDDSNFEVYGPCRIRGNNLDTYHINNKNQAISATLFVCGCGRGRPTSIEIIGSEESQDLVSKVLGLEEIEKDFCDCGKYWCFYKEPKGKKSSDVR